MLVEWYGLGDTAEAVLHGEASLAIARQDNLREQMAYTLTDLGLAYGGIGQWAQGIKTFEEGRAIWRELDNLPMLANNLSNSTISYVLTGDFDKAMAAGIEAHEISRSIDNVWGQISSMIMSLHVLREYAEISQGIRRFYEAQNRLKGIETVNHAVAFGKGIISWMYADLGAAALGQSEFEAACELVDTQPGFIKPWLIATLSLREIEAENLDTGADFLDRCLQILKLDGVYSPAHVVAYLARGRLSLARGSYQQAIGEFRDMLAAFREAGVLWLAADAHYHRSQAHLALGETKEGYGALVQARDMAEPLNSRRILWRIYAGLAAIEPDEGAAAAYREQARQIVNDIAGYAGSGPLRDAFLNLTEVKVLSKTEPDSQSG
jgi:tetratricopeptide (TPR) repeat protein